VPCYLLHTIEQPDSEPYADSDVKDVVGALPRFYCTKVQPIADLRPGEAVRCLDRDAPCWNPAGPSSD